MADGSHAGEGLDSPLSPFQPNFTGGALGGSPTMAHGLQYSPIAEDNYGASPPGTGTSTSSSARASLGASRPSATATTVEHPTNDLSGEDVDVDANRSPTDPNSKTYSFVALPGNTVKKRPRRRYDEIERLYRCR